MLKNGYPFFNEIVYKDFESFNQEISQKRRELYNKSYNLLNNKEQIIDISKIEKIENGRFTTTVEGTEFECLFVRKDTKKLYVQFSGSRELNDTLPIFKRWSYSSFIDGSVLSFADPMYRKFEKLKLGWYYGVKEESYCDYIIRIIKAFSDYLGIKNEDIIFYASSGGGYAALYCASKMEGTTAIVINSQMDLSAYFYAKEFQEITGNDLQCNDDYGRNSVISDMITATQSKFILLENCRAIEDMIQVERLCKQTNYNFRYGLQKVCPNILMWVYDAECRPYHGAQEYAELFWAIDNLRLIFDEVEKYTDVYAYLTEIWHERYVVYEKLLEEKKYGKELKEAAVELLTTDKGLSDSKYRITLLWREDLIIQGEQSCIDIFHDFEDDTVYALMIEESAFENELNNKYLIRLRNKENGNVVLQKEVFTRKSLSMFFKTSINATNLALEVCIKSELKKDSRLEIKNVEIQRVSDFFL